MGNRSIFQRLSRSSYPLVMGNARNDTPKTATASQYRALAEFRYHIRRYLHFSDDAAKAAGLEPKQYQLMLAVKGMPDDVTPTVSALSQQLGTRHHSTVELVNRAERNGLVKRFRDGTYVHVELTKKAKRLSREQSISGCRSCVLPALHL